MDNGLEVINGTSPGTFSSLNINSGYLFLGGLPALVTSSNLAQVFFITLITSNAHTYYF